MKPIGLDSAFKPASFFGKYRGSVVGNIDPQRLGRIQARVPDVLGESTNLWAMPCVPAAGYQSGMFILPPVGSSVWVEFEMGDPKYPIWTGGFWTSVPEVPVLATALQPIPPGQNIVMQTTLGNMLMLSDSSPTPASGGIMLKGAGGSTIIVNSKGIFISNGDGASIALEGSAVTINGQAYLPPA